MCHSMVKNGGLIFFSLQLRPQALFKVNECKIDRYGVFPNRYKISKFTRIVQFNHGFFEIYFMEVQLIYNFVLISAVQQSDSVIDLCIYMHIYVCIYIYSIFFPVMAYDRILNRVPHAPQEDLIYSIYSSSHLLIPNSQSLPSPPSSSWQPRICSLSL